jgi:hypothetical protein
MTSLHGWVFTYTEYTDRWYAATRDNYQKLFSDIDSDDVIGSPSVKTLTILIKKFGGNKKKIDAYLKTHSI